MGKKVTSGSISSSFAGKMSEYSLTIVLQKILFIVSFLCEDKMMMNHFLGIHQTKNTVKMLHAIVGGYALL